MGKHAEKVHEALADRRMAYDNIAGKDYLGPRGLQMHRPGSRNRKKGYNRRGNRRR